MEEFVIGEEQAIAEVKAFVEYHKDETISADEVSKEYPAIIKALRRGNLTFEDNTPTLKLREPIKSIGGGAPLLESINFKTRMTAGTRARLAKGIDLKDDSMRFLNVSIAHFIGTTTAELELIGKHDFKVIEQICTVFM